MPMTRSRLRRWTRVAAVLSGLVTPVACSVEQEGSARPSVQAVSSAPESTIDLSIIAREVPGEWLPTSQEPWSEVDRAKVLKWLHERLLGRKVAGTFRVSGITVTIPHPGQLEWQIEFMMPGPSSEGNKPSRVEFHPDNSMYFRTSDETLVRRLEDFGHAANHAPDGNYPSVQTTGIVTGIEVGAYWMNTPGPGDVYVSLTLDVQSVDIAAQR